MFFFDWLSIYQDFDFKLPIISGRHSRIIDTLTGEELSVSQFPEKYQGSFSTSIFIRISGNRISIKGNPSRINRIENLFGFNSIEQCVEVYNDILRSMGLPVFTKCTKFWHTNDKKDRAVMVSNGAIINEVHITSNVSTGKLNEDVYLKALSTQPYRNSIPRLHSNGKTCDWLTKSGKGGSLIYPSVYNKANELKLHAYPRLLKKHGIDSKEVKYLTSVIDYCKDSGVVRFEQKIKSAFLRRHNLQFYGFSDFTILNTLHSEFINIQDKLKVEAMSFESISNKLLREGICTNLKSSNITSIYAIEWMHGASFDLSKSQVKLHRCRLRKIGIDIALVCDVQKFSLVSVKEVRQINVEPLLVPDWYQHATVNHLKSVA